MNVFIHCMNTYVKLATNQTHIILDNSKYDNLHGGGIFLHAYVIMHKYFGKELEMQKMST